MVTEIKDRHGIVIGYAAGSGYAVYSAPLRVEFNGKPLEIIGVPEIRIASESISHRPPRDVGIFDVSVLPDDSPADDAGQRNERHNRTLDDIRSRNIARPILDSIVEEGQRAQRDNAAGDAIKRRSLSR